MVAKRAAAWEGKTEGKTEVAKLLISKGADLEARSNTGSTPLHYAAFKGMTEVAKLLISKGADVNAKDNFDGTPLHMAEKGGHQDLADFLRKHGGL